MNRSMETGVGREEILSKAEAAVRNLREKILKEAPHLLVVEKERLHYWVMASGGKAFVLEFWPVSRRYKTRTEPTVLRYRMWNDLFKTALAVARGLPKRGGEQR